MDSPITNTPASLCDDLLDGAEAIADFLFGDPTLTRRVSRLKATSNVPLFKIGGRLCARKSQLMQFITTQEQRALGRQQENNP